MLLVLKLLCAPLSPAPAGQTPVDPSMSISSIILAVFGHPHVRAWSGSRGAVPAPAASADAQEEHSEALLQLAKHLQIIQSACKNMASHLWPSTIAHRMSQLGCCARTCY